MKKRMMFLLFSFISPFLMFTSGIGLAREGMGLPTSPTWVWVGFAFIGAIMISSIGAAAIVYSERKEWLEKVVDYLDHKLYGSDDKKK